MFMSTPVIVPCTTVPFLSSIITTSFTSFMRNRTNFILLLSMGGSVLKGTRMSVRSRLVSVFLKELSSKMRRSRLPPELKKKPLESL